MTTFAALSGPLPKLGEVLVAFVAAFALVTAHPRHRAAAALAALVLAPALLLSDIWSSPQLAPAHRHPLLAIAAAAAAIVIVAALGIGTARRPGLVAVLAVAALPFRVPISAGGATSNLLVPLYLVVFAAAIGRVARELRRRPGQETATRMLRPPREAPIEWLLAASVALYGIQAVYSPDFEKALQQTVFFHVPFALLFLLLRQLRWDAALVRRCLLTLAALAMLFSLIGFVEYATKTLLLNPKLVAANQVHTYFTVNSVFFDPDIFGRFLALVMILLAAVLIYERAARTQLTSLAALAVLWACLVLTLSRSSLGALLVGLAILAALRWRAGPVLAVSVLVVAVGAAAIAASPKTFGLNQGLNGFSSGRAGLVTGGVKLFGGRPVWGWGSASFVKEYRHHHPGTRPALAASHTIAVTVAAEQGLIGLAVYLALVIGAAVVLLRRSRGDPVRVALAAAFLALVFHSLLYADFLEDPSTWALLGAAAAMASSPPRQGTPSVAAIPRAAAARVAA